MPNLLVVLLFVAALGAPLAAAEPQRLPSGLEFQLPPGWQITVNADGAVLVPPGHVADSELYFVNIADELQTVDDAKLLGGLVAQYFPNLKLTPAGPPAAIAAAAGRGMVHTYEASSQGVQVKIKLYLVALPGRGAAALAALGKSELIESRGSALAGVAGSFRLSAPSQPDAKPASLANDPWTLRLRDKKLVQFSGYSSGGNSGGMNSQRALYLSADGTYAYRASSSVSMDVPGASGSSSGRQADQGRWRVVVQGADSLLELTSPKNGVEKLKLSLEGNQTFLNGRRWFVVGIKE